MAEPNFQDRWLREQMRARLLAELRAWERYVADELRKEDTRGR